MRDSAAELYVSLRPNIPAIDGDVWTSIHT